VVEIRNWIEIKVPACDNGIFENVSTIIYGRNHNRLQKFKDKVAKFMSDNSDYYLNLIYDDEPIEDFLDEALKRGDFASYLLWNNRMGSDEIGITLDALSNLFGLDFELYDNDCVPFYIRTSNNKPSMDQPIRMWFVGGKKYTLFIEETWPATILKANYLSVNAHREHRASYRK
jgi:hypothetical protein